MAFTYLSGLAEAVGVNGGTSSPFDSTGADLIVLLTGTNNSVGYPTVTDSEGNTWTQERVNGHNTTRLVFYYCSNPNTSANHTITFSTVTNARASVAVGCFFGVDEVDPFEVEDPDFIDTVSAATSINLFDLTPANNDCLMIAGIVSGRGGDPAHSDYAVDSDFIIIGTDPWDTVCQGVGLAYKIQSTAAADGPIWSWTTNAYAQGSVWGFNTDPSKVYNTGGKPFKNNGGGGGKRPSAQLDPTEEVPGVQDVTYTSLGNITYVIGEDITAP